MVQKLNMLFTCGNADMIYDFVQHLVECTLEFIFLDTLHLTLNSNRQRASKQYIHKAQISKNAHQRATNVHKST